MYVGGFVRCKHPPSVVYEIKDAFVYPESDIVVPVVNQRLDYAIYEKSKYPGHIINIPWDSNLLGERSIFSDRKSLDFYLPKKTKKLSRVINLLSTHDWHWLHALVEMIPPVMWCLQNGIDGDLLVSARADPNIIEILTILLEKFHDNRKIIFCEQGESVFCQDLVLLPHGVYLNNHALVINNSGIVINEWAKTAIRELSVYLRLYFSDRVTSSSYGGKVFLNRTGARGAKNSDQVLSLVKSFGFDVLDDLVKLYGKDLNLKKKMEIYGGMSHIIGFYGSALGNVLFCEQGTHCLMLGSSARSLDISLNAFNYINAIYFQCPEVSSNVHSDIVVPIDQLRECLQQWSNS